MEEKGTVKFFCNPKFKEKMVELYGVENPSQCEEIHKRQHGFTLKRHNNGMVYRGSYEKDFIDFSIENKIEIENFKGTISYYFEGKDRKYFPDFYIKNKNLVVEIKSTWTYKADLEQNEAKKKAAIDSGFNFIFVIDKCYNSLIIN